MDFLRLSDPIEQMVAVKVLELALQIKEEEDKRNMENTSIAVQNGVARAFSG